MKLEVKNKSVKEVNDALRTLEVNLLQYGCHVICYSVNEKNELEITDVTREHMVNRYGEDYIHVPSTYPGVRGNDVLL